MEEWISANSALELVRAGGDRWAAQEAILKRAHAGMVRALAVRLLVEDVVQDYREIPRSFWWAATGQSLRSDWVRGDFETWINGNKDKERVWLRRGQATATVRAFGVTFLSDEIAALLPIDASRVDEPDSNPVSQHELEKFYELFQKLNGRCGEDAVMQAAKSFFPQNSVSRARIRALRGPQSMGRPAKAAE